MNALRLFYPVCTLDNRLLLDAGTVLTSQILEELTSPHKNESCEVLSLLEYGTIYRDLLRFFRQGP